MYSDYNPNARNHPNALANKNFMGEVVLGEQNHNQQPRRSIYLEGAHDYYIGGPSQNNPARVAPIPVKFIDNKVPSRANKRPSEGVIYGTLKPMFNVLRIAGIFPIGMVDKKEGIFKVTPKWMGYSVGVFLVISVYIGYIKWDKIEFVASSEGRFEEAVINYLFSVYLVPVIMVPIIWYESGKLAKVTTDWVHFERVYGKVTKNKLPVFLGNRPLVIIIGLPFLSCATMVVTHITMVNFRFIQVIPYCYINTITYLIGGAWYLQCDVIGRVATAITEDFKLALRHIGPATQVAEYRSLWMMLSKLIRDVGNAYGYTLTFLCLYLFLTITLTIYGLLSQIQQGLGIKDIGLAITAGFAIAILFFLCDEAHYASNCVRVQFQKRLLLVELTWMNEDAQQEINMFLRATEMSTTDMSLGGFFDVNRNLFKSLLATMVTYLVVLLQFQISIPEDNMNDLNGTAFSTGTSSTQAPK